MGYKSRAALAAAYVALIFLSGPYFPVFWVAASEQTGVSFDAMALYPLVICSGAVLAYVVRRARSLRFSLTGLAALSIPYVYLYNRQFVAPVERLHLVEYGLLTWVAYRAWESSARSWLWNATIAMTFSAFVGALDEFVQAYTPGRFGEFRDVWINWMSSGLGLACLLVIARPWDGRLRLNR